MACLAFWVDFMPFIQYVPAWVPGAAAAKIGARSRPIVQRMRDMPFDNVKYGEVLFHFLLLTAAHHLLPETK